MKISGHMLIGQRSVKGHKKPYARKTQQPMNLLNRRFWVAINNMSIKLQH
ncbi:MAG: ribosomal protein L28 [Marinomonas primoryensis]|jgi:ribosomal protein L28